MNWHSHSPIQRKKTTANKRNGIAPNLNEGNNSKETFIKLKYAGQKGEKLMPKMKKIVIH